MQWMHRLLSRIQRGKLPEVGDCIEKSFAQYIYLGQETFAPEIKKNPSNFIYSHAVFDIENEILKWVSEEWLEDVYVISRFSDSVDSYDDMI